MKRTSFLGDQRSRGTKSNVPRLNESIQPVVRDQPPIIKEQGSNQKCESIGDQLKNWLLNNTVTFLFAVAVIFTLIVIASGWNVNISLLMFLLMCLTNTIVGVKGGTPPLSKGQDGGSDS